MKNIKRQLVLIIFYCLACMACHDAKAMENNEEINKKETININENNEKQSKKKIEKVPEILYKKFITLHSSKCTPEILGIDPNDSSIINDQFKKNYEQRLTNQIILGGYYYKMIMECKKPKKLRFSNAKDYGSVLSLIMNFLYPFACEDDLTRSPNRIDFHIEDPEKRFYTIFYDNFREQIEKEKGNIDDFLILCYPKDRLPEKKLTYYQYKASSQQKLYFNLGNILIAFDKKAVYIRPEKIKRVLDFSTDTVKTIIEGGQSYVRNSWIGSFFTSYNLMSKNDKSGWKKFYLHSKIKSILNEFPDETKDMLYVYQLVNFLRNSAQEEKNTKAQECLNIIYRMYTYTEQRLGNEVFIPKNDFTALTAYHCFLIASQKYDEAILFLSVIKPFLDLKEKIFVINNVENSDLTPENIREAAELVLKQEEDLKFIEDKSIRSYLYSIILCIHEIIKTAKKPGEFLCTARIFNSNCHAQFIKKEKKNKENNDNKKSDDFLLYKITIQEEGDSDNENQEENTNDDDKSDDDNNTFYNLSNTTNYNLNLFNNEEWKE